MNELQDQIDKSLLATANIIVQAKTGQQITARALCDAGSQVNLITSECIQALKVKETKMKIELNGVGGPTSATIRGTIRLTMQSKVNQSFQMLAQFLVVNKITNELPSVKLDNSEWKHLQEIKLADDKYNEPGRIDVLLGSNAMSHVMQTDIRRGEDGQPIAQLTSLGWIIYGHVATDIPNLATYNVTQPEDTTELQELLKRFWDTQEPPTKSATRTEEEQMCEEHYQRTVKRLPCGRYMVSIPFRPGDTRKLGNSKNTALRRLYQMEHRFEKNENLRQQYVEFMHQYENLGHMIDVTGQIDEEEQHYFIPHHAVNDGNKFRVVFNGSSPTSTGVSVNDLQMIGETMTTPIADNSTQFREPRIGVTTDIKKMFRQIKINPEDRRYQLVLWRAKPTDQIRTFALDTVAQGKRYAPHSANRTIIEHANRLEHKYPRAVATVRKKRYVDDILAGEDEEEAACDLIDELNEFFAEGGFELSKWHSNSWVVINHLNNRAHVGQEMAIGGDDASVLGLIWVTLDDTYRFKVKPPTGQTTTKRGITSHTARLYDPNGYLAPVILTAKVAIQELWKANCGWDQQAPEPILTQWNQWLTEINQLEKVRINRWFGTNLNSNKQLHGFCDASMRAYAAVVYLRVQNENEPVRISLVAAKTRVAPLKQLTIPKLELNGALELAQLLSANAKLLNVSMENCHAWTDSTIVQCWLRKAPSQLREYVSNRVEKIQNYTKLAKWHHVPTEHNPADVASRGCLPHEIIDHPLWWTGPKWLMEDEVTWPADPPAITQRVWKEVNAEIRPPKVLVITQITPLIENHRGDLLPQCGNVNRAINTLAWIRRFATNSRTENVNRIIGPLTNDEKYEARMMWIRHRQAVYYSKEIEACKQQISLPLKTKLTGCNPFLDSEGVLRVGSRLERATIDFDQKHPIILCPDDYFTHLWVNHAHSQTLHGGTQLMIQYLRSTFWIPKLRRLVKAITAKCLPCFRQRKIPSTQLMGLLPSDRVNPGRAFESTGVDYCGPFSIKERKGRCKIITKAYVAVFVCQKSRAVHLELVSELTTLAFMAAFRRLVARRGRVSRIMSDNGTTFVGAARELAEIYKIWRKVATSDELADLSTTWSFITPLAPHQGGLWEAAVKSAKHHLRRVIGPHILTFEEMTTLLCDIEACLNSRPLCATSDEAGDVIVLTPAHLLIGQQIVAPPAKNLLRAPANYVNRWKFLQRSQQSFWAEWQREYLHSLGQRSKWKTQNANIAIGDVVLIHQDQPPTHWPIAIVTKVFPGRDGLVRNIEVTFNGSKYKRPVQKVSLIPWITEQDTLPDDTIVPGLGQEPIQLPESSQPSQPLTDGDWDAAVIDELFA